MPHDDAPACRLVSASLEVTEVRTDAFGIDHTYITREQLAGDPAEFPAPDGWPPAGIVPEPMDEETIRLFDLMMKEAGSENYP